MANTWYSYNGGGADVTDAASYTRMTVKPGCLNGPNVCAIYAPNGGISPTPLSTRILQYIADGQATKLAQPQIPVNAKFFVYLKTL